MNLLRSFRTWLFLRNVDRRVYRKHPQLRERAEAIAAARQNHRKTKQLQEDQQNDMLRLLRENM
ncbi:hypothetical protein [Sinorhizobium sp. NFACC03]|uniref:hypothetical protein n=1 Tax=Sinorhizobium sp. NFACC03 TaxID=1566295 RepID=UPI00088B90B9|nr:hypothetical protein [Sinorhizobium sp. NFACC03]SDA47921.1 hypothetical protein SAMN03159448_00904 [Sinorhizobium sp. NFACC03]